MHRREFLAAAAAIGSAAPILGLPGLAAATPEPRFSGPHVHDNLAIYFAEGLSAPGPVPLTLSEGLARGQVVVHETGDVNRLVIENRGDEEVFVQAGEIVKGGKQDRVLTVSLLLPKRSGALPVAAYCVEHGRWRQRGDEEVRRFSSADSAMPSLKAKIAMRAPSEGQVGADTGRRQSEVWKDVDALQRKLAGTVGAPVSAPESRSSLQLSLENARLRETVAAYVKALAPAVLRVPDSIGLAFAVNGAINSADLYPSHGLFLKLWPKLLNAAATEAVAEKPVNGTPGAPPPASAIAAFVERAERGPAGESRIDGRTTLATRVTERSYYFETRRGDAVIHKNYLAR